MAFRNWEAQGVLTNQNILPLSGSATQKALYEFQPLTTKIKLEYGSTKEVLGVTDGSCQSQILATILDQAKYTVSFEIDEVNSGVLAVMAGEAWAPTSAYNGKEFIKKTVPTSSPYTIVDADNILTTFTAASIQVMVANNGAWGSIRPLEVIVGSGTPTIDQVKLDPTTGTLTFNSGNAGAAIKYAPLKAFTTIDTLGLETSYRKLNDLRYFGKVCTTSNEDVYVDIPSMTQAAGWEIGIGGDTKLTLDFRASVSGSNRTPVIFLREAVA